MKLNETNKLLNRPRKKSLGDACFKLSSEKLYVLQTKKNASIPASYR